MLGSHVDMGADVRESGSLTVIDALETMQFCFFPVYPRQ